MKREQCITIRPGPISHKVILRVGARVITQLVPADNPVEAVQLWAEKAYKRLRKVSYLPTHRSRKMRTLFFYASNDRVAIKSAGLRVHEQHPDGEVISLQGPDHQFIDLKGE